MASRCVLGRRRALFPRTVLATFLARANSCSAVRWMREFTVLAVLASALHCPFTVTVDQFTFVVAGMRRVRPGATFRALRPCGGFVPPLSFHRLSRSSAARVLVFALFLIVSGAETVLFPSVANAT